MSQAKDRSVVIQQVYLGASGQHTRAFGQDRLLGIESGLCNDLIAL